MQRDWGYALSMLWYVAHAPTCYSRDFVLATGETLTVRNLHRWHLLCWINISWEGQGKNEKGIDASNRQGSVEVDPITTALPS
jgi:GDP-D-mannose dehydratase